MVSHGPSGTHPKALCFTAMSYPLFLTFIVYYGVQRPSANLDTTKS